MKKIILLFILCTYFGYAQYKEASYFDILKNNERILSVKDSTAKVAKNNWLHRWIWNSRTDFDKDGNFYYLNPAYKTDFSFLNNSKTEKNNILSSTSWTPVGPIQMPPTYVPRSCYAMGRINCVAFHPTDSNVIWIGTPGGGIWKSVNHGKDWLPQGDNLASMAISHIEVNPKNPDILYAATGDFDISGMTSGNTVGVIKSKDGGYTWETTTLLNEATFGSSALRKIILHPDSTDMMLVAGRKGIWKSLDAGITWKRVCDSIITDMEINPKNPSILFAAMGQLYNQGSAGVLKSTDFGETWEVLNTGIPAKGEISRVELAIAPSYPDFIYVLNVKTASNSFHSLYCSTDGGDSWAMSSAVDSTNNILGAWGGNTGDNYGQGSYDLVLLVDPVDKYKIYTGGINIWTSNDMGRNWKQASFWIYVFGESIHADHHYAAYNPLDKKMYWCNDGGIYRTKTIKPGDQNWVVNWIDTYEENIKEGAPDVKFPTIWENLNNGLAITEFYRMSMSRNNDNVLAGGSQDNSCYYFNNGQWLNYIPNYDGMETMIDHDNTDIFYGVWQNGGLCKTTDGGKTIKTRLTKEINERGNWITPTGMNPANSSHIYMGYRNLWESFDGGETWTKALDFDLLDSTSLNKSSLTIIKNSYSSPDAIAIYKNSTFVQDTAKNWVRVPGELWITNDGCKSWRKSTNNLPLDSLDIVSIEFDRKNPLIMWAGINTWIRNINLYHSTDGGETWTDVSQQLPPGIRINAVLHQQNKMNTIYAGTNKGVYYCDTATTEWKPFSENLPLTIVNDLELQESTGEIFAATYGRGIWRTSLRGNDVENHLINNPKIVILPLPVEDKLTIRFDNNQFMKNELIDVKIVNVQGFEVYSEKQSFANEITITPNLTEGVYFLILKIGQKEYSSKFLVQKK